MIGIFDSGLGGLTVAREIMKEMPEVPVIYFGDTARTPYGGKSKETIIKYALEDAEFLISKGAKILVVACNTVSAVAISALKEKYEIPVFEVITPAAKKAVATTKNGRIGIIGTRATITSKVYEEKIKNLSPEKKVFSASCPLLVPLVEENWLDRPETKSVARCYLQPLKSAQIDTLILGCTHYPFLKKIIQPKIGRKVKIVDSAEMVAKEVKEYCASNPTVCHSRDLPATPASCLAWRAGGGNPENRFFASDITPYFENLASKWLGRNVRIEKVSV
jgi:glutamate racemase